MLQKRSRLNSEGLPDRPQTAAEGRRNIGKAHGAKSEAVRQRAILALLSEGTLERAASQCGISERTLRRWLTDDPGFRAEYETARIAAFDAGMARIQALTGRAVETLADLLGAVDSPTVRLGAARTVAEMAVRQRDSETITRKLDEI